MKRTHLRLSAMTIAACASFSTSAAINSAAIIASSLSPDCLEYKIVGICYWLYCTPAGCKVRTSTKVRHYIPDAVVSAYANTGDNPWTEVSPLGAPNLTAQAGNDGTTNHSNENTIIRFKEADVLGHPGAAAFSRFASASGYTCKGATTPFVPYMLSTLDSIAWRYGIPESVYPESLTPGMREIGGMLAGDLWGNVYPRDGFLHQTNDYKAAAVIAQRAGDITTRDGQPHLYQPILASSEDGYWPAGALLEGDAKTGKWQELTPVLSQTCAVFPNGEQHAQAEDEAYAWALWRPYSCCQRRGQKFLGSTDFQ
ncbi:TIGR03756 family integrating conjugative element protein [Pseudomonas sp. RW407]|uniref:TIGR03756 family integrating conjugative element protein n=1 Tax=Pseudomonas sp. RW407 TaxID=2202894 RepID=UPI000D6EF9A9|nr:TIGR03756 family integrating conjugative element protein [Pseudomonas sp. RW407]PWU28670.1 TIGR03756 family integrating conjugative element protein [Pseudomonas sp. RW407]